MRRDGAFHLLVTRSRLLPGNGFCHQYPSVVKNGSRCLAGEEIAPAIGCGLI